MNDVYCDEAAPLKCVKAMSDQVKGFWESRGKKVLVPPTYEAYKAYLAARKAWRSSDNHCLPTIEKRRSPLILNSWTHISDVGLLL
jgi:hypothetical protein